MFALLLDIFMDVTLPIIVLILLGFIGQRWQRMDAASLNKLVIHILLPPFLIYAFAIPTIPLTAMGGDAALIAVQSLALMVLGWVWGRIMGLKAPQNAVIAFGLACPNSINYGIPFVELALGSTYVPAQAIAGSVHSVLMMSLGVAVLSGSESGIGRSIIGTLKSPVFLAMAIGMGLRISGVELPRAVHYPLSLVGQGYALLALVVLGVQLASVRWQAGPWPLVVSVVGALVIAPLATVGVLWAAHLSGFAVPADSSALLVVNGALPAGAGLAILGSLYGKDKALPTALVVASTILSPITLTIVVFLLRQGVLLPL